MGVVTSYTFTNVTADHTIAASFALTYYTLSVTTAGNGTGSVTKDPDLPQHPSGSTVRLTSVPGAGSGFTGWSGDASGVDNPLDLVMHGNKNVIATFTIGTHTLTTNVTPANGGMVNPDLPGPSYDYGTSVTLTAMPVTGHHFVGWSGAVSGSTNPLTVTMNADKTITATFAADSTRSPPARRRPAAERIDRDVPGPCTTTARW